MPQPPPLRDYPRGAGVRHPGPAGLWRTFRVSRAAVSCGLAATRSDTCAAPVRIFDGRACTHLLDHAAGHASSCTASPSAASTSAVLAARQDGANLRRSTELAAADRSFCSVSMPRESPQNFAIRLPARCLVGPRGHQHCNVSQKCCCPRAAKLHSAAVSRHGLIKRTFRSARGISARIWASAYSYH